MAPSAQRRKVWLTRTIRVPCNDAANIGERKTWRTQSERCTWQNSVRGYSPRKRIYSVSAQETAKHHVKFGSFPLSDVAAVMKRRRETRCNSLGCSKPTKRSQPLVGRSLPYGQDMCERYCCLTRFFPIVDTCLSCEDIVPEICAMVRIWRIFGDFLRTVFPASRVQHVSDLHPKLALRPHHA